MKLTRRALAAAVAGTAVLAAQTPPQPADPADELEAARESLKRNSETLSRFDVPMATEPACVFKP